MASASASYLATQQSIGSKITNVINNTDLGDFGSVNIDSPSDGQALIYDSDTSKWIAGTVSAEGSITATQVKNLLVTVDGAGSGVDADLLDGQQGTHYTNAGNLTGSASGISSVTVNSIMTVVSTTTTLATAGTTATDMVLRVVEMLRLKGVVEKFGVAPESIPDLLALAGDTADGIPGVPRWGRSHATARQTH